MSALTLAMTPPKSLKRSYSDAGLQAPTNAPNNVEAFPSYTIDISNQKPGSAQTTDPSVETIIATVVPGAEGDSSSAAADGASFYLSSLTNQAPAKRTKLTFEEREVKRIEKDFKAREKAEEKIKKDEEKAKKEEEKRIRDALKQEEKVKKEQERQIRDTEKEEKRKAKEQQAHLKLEEKRTRDEEKKRQEDEKDKKSRVCISMRT